MIDKLPDFILERIFEFTYDEQDPEAYIRFNHQLGTQCQSLYNWCHRKYYWDRCYNRFFPRFKIKTESLHNGPVTDNCNIKYVNSWTGPYDDSNEHGFVYRIIIWGNGPTSIPMGRCNDPFHYHQAKFRTMNSSKFKETFHRSMIKFLAKKTKELKKYEALEDRTAWQERAAKAVLKEVVNVRKQAARYRRISKLHTKYTKKKKSVQK